MNHVQKSDKAAFFPNFFLQIILFIVLLVCWYFYQEALIGTEPQYSGGPACTSTTLSGQVISCLDYTYQEIAFLRTIMVICIILMVFGGIAGLFAWSGALVNLARGQHWGWFTCMFLFSGITMFVYLIGGPAAPEAGSLPVSPQSISNQFNPSLAAYNQLSVFPPQTPAEPLPI